MLSPPNTQSQPWSAPASGGFVSRRWLTLARVAWILCTLFLLANFVASIPAYYRLMLTICTQAPQVPCTLPGQVTPSWQLTPANVHALAQLHLALPIYAAYFVTVTVVVSLPYWGLGLLLFWRKSQEWMGLFLSLVTVLFGATGIIDTLLGAYVPAQSPLLLLVLLYLIQVVQWTALGAFLLTFPTGRFVPRWSWLLISLWFMLEVLSPLFPVWPPLLSGAVELVVFGSTLLMMIYRYVRVFDAVQRQQTKWYLYGAGVAGFLLILGEALPGVVPGLSVADSPYQLLNATTPLVCLAIPPLVGGIAILRYRLWDIDVLINRTLVYGTLTVLLALIYVGLVIGLQALVRLFTGQVSQSPVAIVASTLVIAALFQPLRRGIQRMIDRRFYRSKYDAGKIVATFSATLRNEVDLDQLQDHLLAVVQETMQPSHVSLWLRPLEQDRKQRAPGRVTPPGFSEDI